MKKNETLNIVTRVASLPLISSAYSMCSAFYTHAKETHPHLNTACSVVELVLEDGVTLTKSVVSSTVHTARDAATGAQQLVAKRMAEAIDLTKDIVQDSVALTKLVVNSTVNTAVNAASEAKGLVSHRVADVVNLSKGTVQDSVDLTKMVVHSTVSTACQAAHGTKDLVLTGHVKTCGPVQEGIEMTSLIRQVLSSGMGTMLNRTEELVDHYLPMTEEELVELAAEVRGGSPVSVTEQQQLQSYFVRLGSLSSKVRQRAYLHSLKKLRLVKENTQNTLSQLQLVEHLKHGVGQRFQDAQEKLNNILREWLQTQPGERQSAGEDALQEVESRTLTMLRILTKHLGPMYTQVVARIEGLPSHVGERIDQAISNIRQLHTSFSSAGSIQDLTSSILAQSNEKIADAHEALDSLVDHVVQNTPLNWVVGPFRPSPAATVAKAEASASGQEEAAAEEPTDTGMSMMSSAEEAKPKVTAPGAVAHESAKRTDKAGEVEESKMEDTPSKAWAEDAPASHVPKKAKKLLKAVEEGREL
ncbi:Perilipin-3 [Varanus komodoensis]|nr:Perilipin-3 [Varanus komodoensis]